MPQSNAPSSALAAAAHLDDHSPPQASSPAGIDSCWLESMHPSIVARSPHPSLKKKSTAPPVRLHLSMNVSPSPRAVCPHEENQTLSVRPCCCLKTGRERERSGNVRCNRRCRHGILPKAGSESGPRHEIPTVLLACFLQAPPVQFFFLVSVAWLRCSSIGFSTVQG